MIGVRDIVCFGLSSLLSLSHPLNLALSNITLIDIALIVVLRRAREADLDDPDQMETAEKLLECLLMTSGRMGMALALTSGCHHRMCIARTRRAFQQQPGGLPNWHSSCSSAVETCLWDCLSRGGRC